MVLEEVPVVSLSSMRCARQGLPGAGLLFLTGLGSAVGPYFRTSLSLRRPGKSTGGVLGFFPIESFSESLSVGMLCVQN